MDPLNSKRKWAGELKNEIELARKLRAEEELFATDADIMNMFLNSLVRELEKVLTILEKNNDFHQARDEMNSHIHIADIVHAPLTTETSRAVYRLEDIIARARKFVTENA